MASVKFYLKIYSLSLGFVVSFASFCWMALILYVLSQTDPGSTGLMLARYLDISFGLLAFTSSLALLYGAFVESKVRGFVNVIICERELTQPLIKICPWVEEGALKQLGQEGGGYCAHHS